jgi:hypothetical protein
VNVTVQHQIGSGSLQNILHSLGIAQPSSLGDPLF